MNFYMILWHNPHSSTNGWDLVYATDKREARRKYQSEHYSPIDGIASQDDERHRAKRESMTYPDDTLFGGITEAEYEQARAGAVVNIEEGT